MNTREIQRPKITDTLATAGEKSVLLQVTGLYAFALGQLEKNVYSEIVLGWEQELGMVSSAEVAQMTPFKNAAPALPAQNARIEAVFHQGGWFIDQKTNKRHFTEESIGIEYSEDAAGTVARMITFRLATETDFKKVVVYFSQAYQARKFSRKTYTQLIDKLLRVYPKFSFRA